jgi:hypothetical protein
MKETAIIKLLQFFLGAGNKNNVTFSIFYLVSNGNGIKQLFSPSKNTGFKSYIICKCLWNQDKFRYVLIQYIWKLQYRARAAQNFWHHNCE